MKDLKIIAILTLIGIMLMSCNNDCNCEFQKVETSVIWDNTLPTVIYQDVYSHDSDITDCDMEGISGRGNSFLVCD